MCKAYSEDLRLKVLRAIDGGMKKLAAHRTFQVSRSTIDDWLRQRDEVGHVRALPPVRRGPVPAIADLQAFEAFALRHQGLTLEGMSQAYETEQGHRLSRNTFSLALQKIDWTRKKRAGSTVSATKNNATSSRNN